MLEEEDYKQHDFGYIGAIAILEEGDDCVCFPKNELVRELLKVLEIQPEYIDEMMIGNAGYYRIVILFGGDESLVIYAKASILTKELKTWIEQWL